MVCLARKHRHFSDKLLHDILSQPKVVVQNLATPEARKLYNMYAQVKKSMNRETAFVRFKVSKKGILFAKVKTEHNTEDIIVNNFLRKFPMFLILIGSERGTFIGRWGGGINFTKDSLDKVLEHFERNMPVNTMLEGLDEFDEDVWAGYYNSQYNPRLASMKRFQKLMPKKYHKMEALKHELKAVNKNKSILDF